MMILIRPLYSDTRMIAVNAADIAELAVDCDGATEIFFGTERENECTAEPIESLIRRINAARQGNTPALPPEVEPAVH